jgi:hypothetical protein
LICEVNQAALEQVSSKRHTETVFFRDVFTKFAPRVLFSLEEGDGDIPSGSLWPDNLFALKIK